MFKRIPQCRICGNGQLDSILNLGPQALTGVFPRARNSPVTVGPLELVKCRADGSTCGLVQLRHSFEASEMYGLNYGYRSGLNRSMTAHLQKLARRVKSMARLSPGDLVLDIGSNDATLLRALDEPGMQLVGMDPTGVKFRQYYPDHIRLVPEFFSAERFRADFGDRKARLVTSIAMFYDLESPLDFMLQVADILADDGVWIFEQSYLPTMLARNSYDTVCHEHLEYYALKQILWMADRARLKILDVELNDINGGSFRVYVSRITAPYSVNEAQVTRLLNEERDCGLDRSRIYEEFTDRVFRQRDEIHSFFRETAKNGERVLGYGASTKGNVLLQFCGITTAELACVAEVNEDKFGAFTPGTLIPIVSEQEARALNPSAFFVLPWHFRDSIINREAKFLSTGGKLIFPLPALEVVSEESAHCRA